MLWLVVSMSRTWEDFKSESLYFRWSRSRALWRRGQRDAHHYGENTLDWGPRARYRGRFDLTNPGPFVKSQPNPRLLNTPLKRFLGNDLPM